MGLVRRETRVANRGGVGAAMNSYAFGWLDKIALRVRSDESTPALDPSFQAELAACAGASWWPTICWCQYEASSVGLVVD